MKVALLSLLILSSSAFAGFVKKGTSFEVLPERLGSNVHYGVEFYKNSVPSFVDEFDIEGVSRNDARVTIFFKSALIIDRPIEEIDLSQFEKSSVHAQILDGSVLKEYDDAPFNWRMGVKILVKNVTFDYQAYLTQGLTEDETINNYIKASKALDRNLPATEYYLIQYLDRYNAAIDRMITLSKIIPYKGKTMVVTYQLSHLYKSFYKKYNIFNAVKKIFTKRLTDTIDKTKEFLQ